MLGIYAVNMLVVAHCSEHTHPINSSVEPMITGATMAFNASNVVNAHCAGEENTDGKCQTYHNISDAILIVNLIKKSPF